MALGSRRLWRIETKGETIGTLSIGFYGSDGLCQIKQLRGFRNRHLGSDVWLAAERWFRRSDPMYLAHRNGYVVNRKAWRQIWRPYWLARKSLPDWLPLCGTERVFDEI